MPITLQTISFQKPLIVTERNGQAIEDNELIKQSFKTISNQSSTGLKFSSTTNPSREQSRKSAATIIKLVSRSSSSGTTQITTKPLSAYVATKCNKNNFATNGATKLVTSQRLPAPQMKFSNQNVNYKTNKLTPKYATGKPTINDNANCSKAISYKIIKLNTLELNTKLFSNKNVDYETNKHILKYSSVNELIQDRANCAEASFNIIKLNSSALKSSQLLPNRKTETEYETNQLIPKYSTAKKTILSSTNFHKQGSSNITKLKPSELESKQLFSNKSADFEENQLSSKYSIVKERIHNSASSTTTNLSTNHVISSAMQDTASHVKKYRLVIKNVKPLLRVASPKQTVTFPKNGEFHLKKLTNISEICDSSSKLGSSISAILHSGCTRKLQSENDGISTTHLDINPEKSILKIKGTSTQESNALVCLPSEHAQAENSAYSEIDKPISSIVPEQPQDINSSNCEINKSLSYLLSEHKQKRNSPNSEFNESLECLQDENSFDSEINKSLARLSSEHMQDRISSHHEIKKILESLPSEHTLTKISSNSDIIKFLASLPFEATQEGNSSDYEIIELLSFPSGDIQKENSSHPEGNKSSKSHLSENTQNENSSNIQIQENDGLCHSNLEANCELQFKIILNASLFYTYEVIDDEQYFVKLKQYIVDGNESEENFKHNEIEAIVEEISEIGKRYFQYQHMSSFCNELENMTAPSMDPDFDLSTFNDIIDVFECTKVGLPMYITFTKDSIKFVFKVLLSTRPKRFKEIVGILKIHISVCAHSIRNFALMLLRTSEPFKKTLQTFHIYKLLRSKYCNFLRILFIIHKILEKLELIRLQNSG